MGTIKMCAQVTWEHPQTVWMCQWTVVSNNGLSVLGSAMAGYGARLGHIKQQDWRNAHLSALQNLPTAA